MQAGTSCTILLLKTVIPTVEGGSYMKKAILLVCIAVLFPAAACAGEKTLYDISDDMLFLVETYESCADRGNICTGEEAHAIKAGMKNCLRDFVLLVKAGNPTCMMLTPDQSKALSVRAEAVRDQLSHSRNANEVCNASIYFFTYFIVSLMLLVEYLLNPIKILFFIYYLGPVKFILSFIYIVSKTAWSLLMIVALSPACLFWWL
jgi:hypothetical protein